MLLAEWRLGGKAWAGKNWVRMHSAPARQPISASFWSGKTASARRVRSAGPLRLDLAEHRATLDGKRVETSPLLWKLLLILSSRPNRLITRAELKRELWPYAERIDTERRLNTAMRALRASLRDDVDKPRFIETVRSQGYRWIGNRPDRRRWASIGLGISALAAVLGIIAFAPALRPTPPRAATAVALRAQAAVEDWRGKPSSKSFSDASAAVDEALGQGATPALLVLKADLALGGRWDWKGAERLYSDALDLDPQHADARLGLAWLNANLGRRERAFEMVEQLVASNVMVAGERRADLGWLLLRLNRPALAIEVCNTANAATLNSLSCLHTALAMLGRFPEARKAAVALMTRVDADRDAINRVGAAAPGEGYAAFLQWRSRHFLPPDAPYFQRAQVLADAGDYKAALALLARSVEAREPLAVRVKSTMAFDRLAGDSRYRALVRAVGA